MPDDAAQVVRLLPDGVSAAVLLERLARGEARERDDLSGGANRQGGSGGRLGRFLQVGEELLKTNLACRHEDAAGALADAGDEEVRRALGIYPPERLWFVVAGADDHFWSASLTPLFETVRHRFERREASAWWLYLRAFELSFEVAARHGAILDCNPNNFAVDGDRLHYIDDDLGQGATATFANQALLRLQEYADAPLGARLGFADGFLRLTDARPRELLLRWGLLEDLEAGVRWPQEPAVRERFERLRQRLWSTRAEPA